MRCDSAVFFEEDMVNQLCDDGGATPTSVAVSVNRAPSITTELSKQLLEASLDHRNDQIVEAVNTIEHRQSTLTPPIELEYKPWIPFGTQSFMSETLTSLKDDFDLLPFRTSIAALDEPETDADQNYFRDVDFKPFQKYGNFLEDEIKRKGAVESIRDEVTRVSDLVSAPHQTSLEANQRVRSSSTARHAVVKNFIKNHSELIESEWLKLFLQGESVEFFQYYQEIEKSSSELSLWTVTRCRCFINAMIPSLMYSLHFEEVLFDFFNDFFLPYIVKSANDALLTESDQKHLSGELTKIAAEMIKELITPVMFDKFVSYIYPVIIEEHADFLYETLVETMKAFRMPKPYVPEKFTPPSGKPSKKDPKYKAFRGRDAKLEAFNIDMEKYLVEVDILQSAFKRKHKHKNQHKRDFQADLIRVKKIHKSRAFDYLKCLVTNFGDPIMKPNSRWINGIYLQMPKEEGVDDKNINNNNSNNSKTYSADKKNEPTSLITAVIMGPDVHENQDFFDALFFSRILRACLILEHTVNFIAIHLEPFLKAYQIGQIDSRIGFRYLLVVNRFIKITRFNVVANVVPQVLHYRRYLLAYLIRKGATYMGIEPKKVQSRTVTFELLSLFESLHLYQMYTATSPEYHADKLETIFSVNNLEFSIPIIYLTYNPMSYATIARIMKNVKLSDCRVNAYKEIFAAMKNVEMLPILQRKVLRFKEIIKDPTDETINCLENINQELPLRQQLPKDYDAIYFWSMSKALKKLLKVSVNLYYPYGLFAPRALLARRFGVSFDASNCLAQLKENFEWLESIDFINFYLEREAQFLITRAYPRIIDSDSYQVYRVEDPQKHLHLQRQLASDEPTHHINMLIERTFSKIPQEEVEQIRTTFQGDDLFNEFRRQIGDIVPQVVMNAPAEMGLSILRTITNQKNPS